MAKKIKMNNSFNDKEMLEMNNRMNAVMEAGEMIGNAIVVFLTTRGTSNENLAEDVYGMAKAWAYILEVGKRRGLDLEDCFNAMVPSFQEEAEEMFDDIKENGI